MAGPRVFVRCAVPAPAERVFALLTRADGLSQWFCDEASSDDQAGGEVRVLWNDPDGEPLSRSGAWQRLEPPHVATLVWDGPPNWPGDEADVLEFAIAPSEDGGSVVTVSSGLPGGFDRLAEATLVDATEASWRQCFADLALALAHGGAGQTHEDDPGATGDVA